MMQNVIERPRLIVQPVSPEDAASRDALWVIDALAQELAGNAQLDRQALVDALRRRAGYEQADSLWPAGHDALHASLVRRLADRLARG